MALKNYTKLEKTCVFVGPGWRGVLTWLDGKVDVAPEGLCARSYVHPVPAQYGSNGGSNGAVGSLERCRAAA